MRRACPQLDWGTRPHRHRLVSHEPCRSLDTPSVEKELARAGRRPRRATAGCSFGTRRGSPASDTLGPRRGAMQGLSAARITRTANVRWHVTAPTRARPRAGRRSLAGIAPRATPPSACCRTVWHARLPGELDDVEAVVAHAERAPSRSAAANALRRDPVGLAGAIRWVQRRVLLVHHALLLVIGLLPEQLERCVAEVGAVRTR